MFCQVMNIVDQMVESKEKMTQIQLIFEQRRKDQQEIEKAAFEARAEKLQAQTEQILKDLQAQWRSWVSEEAVHEEQYSLYQRRGEPRVCCLTLPSSKMTGLARALQVK